ncbi:hypothetical protein ACWF62_17800 [Rhodococcus sp. NPDC054953]
MFKFTRITGPMDAAEFVRRLQAGEVLYWVEWAPGPGRVVLVIR